MILNVYGNICSGKSTIIEGVLSELDETWLYHDVSKLREKFDDIEDKHKRDDAVYAAIKDNVFNAPKNHFIESSGLSVRMRWLYDMDEVYNVKVEATRSDCVFRALRKKYNTEWAFEQSVMDYAKWWDMNEWRITPSIILDASNDEIAMSVGRLLIFIKEIQRK